MLDGKEQITLTNGCKNVDNPTPKQKIEAPKPLFVVFQQLQGSVVNIVITKRDMQSGNGVEMILVFCQPSITSSPNASQPNFARC